MFLVALGAVAPAVAAPLPSASRPDRPVFEAETAEQAKVALQRVGSPAFAQRVVMLVPDLAARLPDSVDPIKWVAERLKADTQGRNGLQVRVVDCDAEQRRLLAQAVTRVLTVPMTAEERSVLTRLQNSKNKMNNVAQVRRGKAVQVQVAQANAAVPPMPAGSEEQEEMQKMTDSVQVELNAKPLRKVR
jgi:hypothetical protein